MAFLDAMAVMVDSTFFKKKTAHLKKKTGSLDAPRVDARGRRTVRTPLCTPLLKQQIG